MSILENVNSPEDIKKLNIAELNELSAEIREMLVNTVSETGGHLASNLGVVELTIALHYVFNSPTDQIVFDVGHQCYTHKILTGRKNRFNTLRTEDGISGFTRPNESEHDIFSSGHSSVSVSQAIGLAKAKQISGDKGKVIAIIGDGALTGGLAYEALNNCDDEYSNLIVILNDNNMSISKNVGSMSKHLTTIRTSRRYFTFKNKFQRAIARVPKIGGQINRFVTMVNSSIRKSIYHNATFFEDMGFRYYGPIDGHDYEDLIPVLNAAKFHTHSVLIHVNTVKGMGYNPAEKNPTKFHGIGKFDIETGEPKTSGETFSSTFGKTICNLAENDGRICCVTAAMTEGTGLSEFAGRFPKRFFDVGIAEQHAVTFSSGLAKNGVVPVFAVYSTFLQRAYDQLIHDVAMQKLKVVFAIDRAGFVGSDGESHQGVFDVAFLNTVPDLSVYAPSDYKELSLMMSRAIYDDNGAAAVRYPRGKASDMPSDYPYENSDYTVIGNAESENCIVTYGREFSECYSALSSLENTFIVKLNKIKPVNNEVVSVAKNAKNIFFFEEAVKTGGIGEVFASMLEENGIHANYKIIAINDEFIKQASVEKQIEMYKLDRQSVINEVSNGKKIRLDVAVFEQGYAPSREKAKAIIMAGQVYVNNQKVDKAGTEIKEDDVLEVRGNTLKYVSRGGLKLEKAMQEFPIDLNGKICMDVGASTGGFTDCMLMNGAVKVYSIDVGYGQLAWKLRCDERVVNLERTNFRYVTAEEVKDKIDFSSVDVSFISLKHILPNLNILLAKDGQAVCLIKPQFEAGKEKVGKKGVVREKSVHLEVVNNVIEMALNNGFSVKGLQFSPIKGPEGNIEYLIFLEKADEPSVSQNVNPDALVNQSHEELL